MALQFGGDRSRSVLSGTGFRAMLRGRDGVGDVPQRRVEAFNRLKKPQENALLSWHDSRVHVSLRLARSFFYSFFSSWFITLVFPYLVPLVSIWFFRLFSS